MIEKLVIAVAVSLNIVLALTFLTDWPKGTRDRVRAFLRRLDEAGTK